MRKKFKIRRFHLLWTPLTPDSVLLLSSWVNRFVGTVLRPVALLLKHKQQCLNLCEKKSWICHCIFYQRNSIDEWNRNRNKMANKKFYCWGEMWNAKYSPVDAIIAPASFFPLSILDKKLYAHPAAKQRNSSKKSVIVTLDFIINCCFALHHFSHANFYSDQLIDESARLSFSMHKNMKSILNCFVFFFFWIATWLKIDSNDCIRIEVIYHRVALYTFVNVIFSKCISENEGVAGMQILTKWPCAHNTFTCNEMHTNIFWHSFTCMYFLHLRMHPKNHTSTICERQTTPRD